MSRKWRGRLFLTGTIPLPLLSFYEMLSAAMLKGWTIVYLNQFAVVAPFYQTLGYMGILLSTRISMGMCSSPRLVSSTNWVLCMK